MQCHLQIHVYPEPQNVTGLEIGTLQRQLVKMRPYWIGVGPNG
jgi:hypothetical protein